MSIGNIIKEYRRTHKMSMQEFADIAHLSKGYISMLEKGRHPQNGKEIIPSIDTVNKIASAMGITIDALLEETAPDQKIRLAETNTPTPVYSAAAGEGILNDGYPTEEIQLRLDVDQAVAYVEGRSMEPTLQDGDMVIIQAQNVPDRQHQICLVKVNGDESTLKRVEMKSEGLVLIGDNPSVYSPHPYTAKEVEELPVKIEGVVVKLIRNIE